MKHTHKISFKRYLPWIGLGLLLIVAFLYIKIVYFPSRVVDGGLHSSDLQKARHMTLDELRSFSGTNAAQSLSSLERMVQQQPSDTGALLTLVDAYIAQYEFDKAFALIKSVYARDEDFSLIPAKTFFFVLMNSSELAVSRYEAVGRIIEEYKTSSRIDDETYTLYSGLFSLYQGKPNTFFAAINQLSGSKQYESLVKGILNAQKRGAEALSTDELYTHGLSALVLLEHNYVRIAQKRAVALRQRDEKYILPVQILAQSAVLQKHRQEAAQYFDMLLKIDTVHVDQHQYGLCMSYFWQGAYDTALLHCGQVKKIYQADAMKYTILSYAQMKNRSALMGVFQNLLRTHTLTENDYYLFFEIVFFQPYLSDKDFSSVEKNYLTVVLPYLNQCVTQYGSTSDVCKYGQVGFYLYKNNLEKAYKDLLVLASRHPTRSLFRVLGEYYLAQGDEEKAKAYYLKALMTDSTNSEDIPSGTGNSAVNN